MFGVFYEIDIKNSGRYFIVAMDRLSGISLLTTESSVSQDVL